MSDKYNLDDIISKYIEIGKLTGTSQIVNNTLKQIEQARYGRQKLKEEKEIWDGYTEPEEKIDINKYIDEVKNMNKDETKIFTIHHPYYRTKIREVSESLGYKCKSSLDANVESNDDSKLIKCLSCKKTIPISKVNWVTDYGSCFGGIMGRDTWCNHCGTRMHSDYEYPTEEFDKKRAHYMYVPGKNTITVWS